MRSIFNTFHPALIFIYFLTAFVFCFVLIHPIYALVSFICASAYNIYLKGLRAFACSLRLYLPLILLIALVNVLFNTTGNTIIFYLGTRTLTLEACVFGFTFAFVLCSVLIWFSNFNETGGSAKFLYLFARLLPTTAMLVSMVFSFVPRFVNKGRMIQASQLALVGGAKLGLRNKTSLATRSASVLAGLAMEDSIEVAACMKAKAYGAPVKRTSFVHYVWKVQDTCVLVVVLVLVFASAWCAFSVVGGFSFYPALSAVKFSWGYVLYALLLLLPLILEVSVRACQRL